MSLIKTQELTSDQELKLQAIIDAIPEILQKTENPEYDEIYGYKIGPSDDTQVQTEVRNEILYKFLVASEHDVEKAKEKLVATLNWRREFQVLSAGYSEKHDEDLEKLGLITEYPENTDNFRVVTWNVYANLKNPKKLFSKFGVGVSKEIDDETESQADATASDTVTSGLPGTMFLRWRVGLMERALSRLNFTDANNNKAAQVHDYNNVSMFRMDPGMKAATKEIISVFSDNYPELLLKKYFVNVSLIMGWMFTFFKATGLMSAATTKKFEMRNHGELQDAFGKDNLPKEYNGGAENSKVPDLYALALTDGDIAIPLYGEEILKKFKFSQSATRSEPTHNEPTKTSE